MSREVRRVPKDWKHPKNERGAFLPLHDGYETARDEFMKLLNEKGLQAALDYFGRAPNQEDYMPDWPDDERTHVMMYETTTEGTPISPAFATVEELARWLADTGASALADRTATYEQWLAMCRQGSSVSAVCTSEGWKSGVEAMEKEGGS